MTETDSCTPTSGGEILSPDYAWYASYGSNLYYDRLGYYINGGTLPGATHRYPGFRDRTPPRDIRTLELPGSIYFAGESSIWTGGVAFYAPKPRETWPTGAAARGYLLTVGQFSDLQAQEMRREPGTDLDLTEVLRTGHCRLGPGRYETLVHADCLDGLPVLTFTSSLDAHRVRLNKPSARYLGMIAAGLRESHRWDADDIIGYLSTLPGIEYRWDPDELGTVVQESLGMATG